MKVSLFGAVLLVKPYTPADFPGKHKFIEGKIVGMDGKPLQSDEHNWTIAFGEVVQVGDGVTDLKKGDKVMWGFSIQFPVIEDYFLLQRNQIMGTWEPWESSHAPASSE